MESVRYWPSVLASSLFFLVAEVVGSLLGIVPAVDEWRDVAVIASRAVVCGLLLPLPVPAIGWKRARKDRLGIRKRPPQGP